MSPEHQHEHAHAHEHERAAAWEALLTTLERATVDDAPAAWTPPTDIGPVPRDLVGRASRLLAAQRDRIAVLTDARAATLDALGALRTAPASQSDATPRYLDASA